jgi:membrane protease YdiL (CAAX protease family)
LPRAKVISLALWGDASSLEIVPNPKQTVQALATSPSDPFFGVHLISKARVSALGWSWNIIDWVTGVLAVVLVLRLRRAQSAVSASPFGAGEAASVFIWAFGAGAACYAAFDFPAWLADWYPVADVAMAALVLAFVWQGRPWSTLTRGLGLTWCGASKLISYSIIVFGVFALFAWLIETPLMALGQVSPWPQDSGDLLLYGSVYDKLVRVVSLVITGPFFEELMFTGLLFGGLLTRLSFRLAALITASLFAAEHAVDLVNSADLLVGSVASCWAFWKTGSIWPSILAHAAYNAMCASVVLY